MKSQIIIEAFLVQLLHSAVDRGLLFCSYCFQSCLKAVKINPQHETKEEHRPERWHATEPVEEVSQSVFNEVNRPWGSDTYQSTGSQDTIVQGPHCPSNPETQSPL